MILLIALLACGGSTKNDTNKNDTSPEPRPDAPSVADYDDTCATVNDCALVVELGDCGCSCDHWSALSKEGAQSFEADQNRYYADYPCRDECDLGCPRLAEEAEVGMECAASVCVALPPEDTGYYTSYYY